MIAMAETGFITITAGGALTRHAETPDAERIRQQVGPEGWDQVPMNRGGMPGHLRRLPPRQQLRGWVNDCGLLAPDTYPRNPVGACVLAALGASGQPYAGTVVITGWDPDSDGPEIRPLTEFDAADIVRVHAAVVGVLERGQASEFGPQWDRKVADYAAFVRDGESPSIRVVSADTYDELMRKVRDGRG